MRNILFSIQHAPLGKRKVFRAVLVVICMALVVWIWILSRDPLSYGAPNPFRLLGNSVQENLKNVEMQP
ncbi:MAG: hypothetical protein A3F26_02140 [Candidatus Ryanbacteria bacterium RIFCSPHIGHO2_12_FULL_47_12b]|uniref:Uncharacterized protein n=2 Tax=Candidatus Ryaniibacteriota TaxID=1817914 RepID=A0A1G2H6S3_9BACT|nr:MAG: hypothetical protein UX74_C0006G0015 [Parcubacteria group bacterium GW2011_GWA2_47_10b]OGZ46664.1 MAG: hypothetical protein A2844_00875 [Candidatus Ryanbacteria bacterium RIFCSPHIGHO2_01_FULL_48_80]OGZ53042.1 MAG: hypothetical protein A3A29_01200 [Candidatus Ryanbacteria bacterium RIFCSPLOWO2_01_FULL_47_79]OGZ53365.1 MAG: hypothetical protein A3F26_02140 [Candidatus Ryanbacteria bacterium RIFCSPHIGHO2_12_FULL_47_12b]OGZ57044.1 MAG: hypothetical protein A3J04_00580 [Candidatus Ryanbacter